MKEILDSSEEKMKAALDALGKQFMTIRSGKASPAIVENVSVEYYGNPTPLNQVANISCPEPRLIMITPWEKPLLGDIERAILQANLGLTPNNDGSIIRIPLPELSGERRKELVKIAKGKAEEFRVSIRNIRRDGNEAIKKLKDDGVSEDEIKGLLDQMQKLTDSYIEKIGAMSDTKEEEILEI
jgi:ribosome recycling factor